MTGAAPATPVAPLYLPLDPAAGAAGLAVARDRVASWLLSAGLRAVALDEMLIAVGEACANVIEHSGAQATADAPAATVECNAERHLVRVVVSDRGRWQPAEPEGTSNRGRGRMLIRALTDATGIRTDENGTVVELVKHLSNTAPSHAPAGADRTALRVEPNGPGELVLTGDLDESGAEALRTAVRDAGAPLLLDLQAVRYLGSSGVAVLFEHAAGLRLVLAEGSAAARVIRYAGLDGPAEVEYRTR